MKLVVSNTEKERWGTGNYVTHEWFILTLFLSKIFPSFQISGTGLGALCDCSHGRQPLHWENCGLSWCDKKQMVLEFSSQTHSPLLISTHTWGTVPWTETLTTAASLALQGHAVWVSLLYSMAFCQAREAGAGLACKCYSEDLGNQHAWGWHSASGGYNLVGKYASLPLCGWTGVPLIELVHIIDSSGLGMSPCISLLSLPHSVLSFLLPGSSFKQATYIPIPILS